MAKTIVGILQLLLKQDVTQRAPEVNRALASIQGAASRLGSAPWGAAFERQLARLKVSPAERAAIAQSYGLLARDINGKINKVDLSNWRTGVLGHIGVVRTGIDEANASAKRFHNTMGKLIRAGLVTTVGVGGLYLGSRALHGGASAASEEWRQKAEARYSGLPDAEREALWNQAVKLAGERRLNTALVFQTLREAALAMETTTDAIAVSDGMSKALLYLSNTLGPDGAVGGLRAFNKAMDNIQNITPEEYLKSLEAYVRAQQMTGADMDPDAFAQAIKYSRSAGKMFSDEYLFNWLPFRIAEVGGSDAGTQLRAFSDNTIGGTATKAVQGYQKQIGVRNEDGSMAFADELLQNPEKWINERLVPALTAAGVDTTDNVQLSQVMNQVASNRLARDFIISAITNWEQKQRLTQNLPRTAGLAAADDIQSANPFATLDGLVTSLENLSGAAGDHVFPVIIPAMTSMADMINAVAVKVRDMPSAAFGLGLGALGLGALGTWKVGTSLVSLATAGPSLQTAAVMLQGAATSLGGKGLPGMPGGPAGAAGAGKGPATLMLGAPLVADWLGTQIFDTIAGPGATEQAKANNDGAWGRTWDRIFGPATPGSNGMVGQEAAETLTATEAAAINAQAQVDALMGQLNGVNSTVAPQVDTSSLVAALGLVQRLSAALTALAGPLATKPAAIKNAVDGLYADYGVAP